MEKTFTGIVSEEGKLKIYDSAGFAGFIGSKKNERVLITIQTEDGKATVFTQNYFYKVVCTAFIEIFKKNYGEHTSEEIVSERLRKFCPVPRKNGEILEVEKMSQDELNYLIKHSKLIASEEFDFYIAD